MSDIKRSETDVDEIMRRIRSEVDARRAAAGPPTPDPAVTDLEASAAWSSIEEAAERAEIGAGLPDLAHVDPLRRVAGRGVTRAILRLSVVLRTRQSHFNHAVVKVLRHLTMRGERTESDLRELRTQVDVFRARFDSNANEVSARFDEVKASLAEVNASLTELAQSAERARLRMGQLDPRIDALPQRSEQGSEPSGGAGIVPSPRAFDGLHAAIMDDLRGPADAIRDRLRVHLAPLEEAGVGHDDAPVLDVGCGRGEWLELVRERGWSGRGADTNPVLVAHCRELGLAVELQDAIGALRGAADGALGAVTAFHLIEHLRFDELVEFIDETVRVLRPGGLLIVETPNPDNLTVGATTFWLDPTHHHPLPAGLMRFVLEARGLTVVDVIELHPVEPPEKPAEASSLPDLVHDRLFGPRDYALIARKP